MTIDGKDARPAGPGHDERWLLWALLLIVTTFVSWFDYVAATAIWNPRGASAGALVFLPLGISNTVFPFTYVGVTASVLGVAWCIARREIPSMGKLPAIAVGLLVGNAVSVGMLDAYEQVYVGLGCLQGSTHAICVAELTYYWGSVGAVGYTLTGLALLLILLPWVRPRNWPGGFSLLLLCGAFFAVWVAAGYASPPHGSALDYWMNAGSRIASQLSLVALVWKTDWVRAGLEVVRLRLAHPPRISDRGIGRE